MFTKETKYLLLIIIIFIAACIETDIYLPAFPDMMAFFSISEEKIQSLLSWNFVGICVSGPLYGPLSDAFGRKKPLLIALGLFLIGSFLTVYATSFDLMLWGRVLQGLGSGGCFTLGTAVIFDSFKEKEAILALNKINSIVPFIMAGAPMLGGFLNLEFGFRSNFIAISALVLISFSVCLFLFEETLPEDKRAPFQTRKILLDYKKVFTSLPFWQTTLIVSLLFAGYLTFLSGISVLFVLELGVKKQVLPFFQASLLGAWLIANLSYRWFIERVGIPNIKRISFMLVLIGGVGLIFSMGIDPKNPYLPTAFMVLYSFGVNWIQGIYFPEGMEIFPDIKGITASLLTSTRLLATAFVVDLSSRFYNGTIYPISTVVSLIIFVILATIIFYERGKERGEVLNMEGVISH